MIKLYILFRTSKHGFLIMDHLIVLYAVVNCASYCRNFDPIIELAFKLYLVAGISECHLKNSLRILRSSNKSLANLMNLKIFCLNTRDFIYFFSVHWHAATRGLFVNNSILILGFINIFHLISSLQTTILLSYGCKAFNQINMMIF